MRMGNEAIGVPKRSYDNVQRVGKYVVVLRGVTPFLLEYLTKV